MSSFVDALENLTAQCKAQMRMSFLEIGSAIKMRLSQPMELLNKRRLRREATFTFEHECCETESEGENVSTQFLRKQKKQLIELQYLFERYSN